MEITSSRTPPYPQCHTPSCTGHSDTLLFDRKAKLWDVLAILPGSIIPHSNGQMCCLLQRKLRGGLRGQWMSFHFWVNRSFKPAAVGIKPAGGTFPVLLVLIICLRRGGVPLLEAEFLFLNVNECFTSLCILLQPPLRRSVRPVRDISTQLQPCSSTREPTSSWAARGLRW